MAHFEKTLEQQELYHGKILNLRRDKVELENGRTSYREVVEHSGGVCVLPITEDGKVLLVSQYRYPYREEVLEAPAGKMDREGESPLACGMRELEEETGHIAGEYLDLGKLYPSPGYTDEVIYLFAARNLTKTVQKLDEGEFLDVRVLEFEEAVRLVLEGNIVDAKTQALLLKAKLMELGK
ncbi:MAG TPA: NUDIX hydrolase [Firmicutes bacterium]|nr:NUDIX hydrolase [Bacillota bacterium]